MVQFCPHGLLLHPVPTLSHIYLHPQPASHKDLLLSIDWTDLALLQRSMAPALWVSDKTRSCCAAWQASWGTGHASALRLDVWRLRMERGDKVILLFLIYFRRPVILFWRLVQPQLEGEGREKTSDIFSDSPQETLKTSFNDYFYDRTLLISIRFCMERLLCQSLLTFSSFLYFEF